MITRTPARGGQICRRTPAAARKRVATFSTTSVPGRDRVARWEKHNRSNLVGLSCSSYTDDGLIAQLTSANLKGVVVADIRANAHVIERSPANVAGAPQDSLFASILIEGEAVFYVAGGFQAVAAGDILLYESDRPYLFGFASPMHQIMVTIPRAHLPDVGALSEPTLLARGHRAPMAALEHSLGGNIEPRETVVDWITAAVLERTGGSTAAYVAAAKDYIRTRLRDAELSVPAVAVAVGLSERHLSRVFGEVSGITVSRYILGLRLDGARADLARRGSDRMIDIAYRWGFSSQPQFNRAFRTRFGHAPGDTPSH
ncbi:MAG: helix-turn-helix domain-containing protein [Segniliparus sp.]|uniref:helix-turn-helix domain-containing protein n=1 Tax=Segniliparus sp. TaxID=2804064 RepID=UPI003F2DC7EF